MSMTFSFVTWDHNDMTFVRARSDVYHYYYYYIRVTSFVSGCSRELVKFDQNLFGSFNDVRVKFKKKKNVNIQYYNNTFVRF